jgi:hypothetical protein
MVGKTKKRRAEKWEKKLNIITYTNQSESVVITVHSIKAQGEGRYGSNPFLTSVLHMGESASCPDFFTL